MFLFKRIRKRYDAPSHRCHTLGIHAFVHREQRLVFDRQVVRAALSCEDRTDSSGTSRNTCDDAPMINAGVNASDRTDAPHGGIGFERPQQQRQRLNACPQTGRSVEDPGLGLWFPLDGEPRQMMRRDAREARSQGVGVCRSDRQRAIIAFRMLDRKSGV